MPDRYSVELSETAQKVYGRMFEEAHACIEAGNETNSKVTRFRMVDEALDKIIPHDPFARDRALAGPLSGIFRVKKGRIRICYIASSENQKIIVLYISDTLRKSGDANDPYNVFSRLLRAGKFDSLLKKIRMPRTP